MFNQGILGQAKSYISTGTGLLKNPRHLLAFTNSSFLRGLSDTTLERIKGRSDPAMSCYWDIQMPDIPAYEEQQSTLGMIVDMAGTVGDFAGKFAGGGVLGSVAGGIQSAAQSVSSVTGKLESAVNKFCGDPCAFIKLDSEYVEALNLTFPEYSTREVFRGGVMRKYPDTNVSIGDLTLTFYVGNDNESYRYIMNWLQLVSTPASEKVPNNVRIWAPPSVYKKIIQVALMDMNGNDIYSINYIGCWPKSFSDVRLDSEGERLLYDVTFSVDTMCTYGFDYVPFTEELMNMATGALKNITGAAMEKASSFITSHAEVSPGTFGDFELF